MADEDLIKGLAVAALVLELFVAACGDAPPQVQTANVAQPAGPPARPYPEDSAAWGDVHGRKARLRIPLPSPQAWTIDDTREGDFRATQAETRSSLVVRIEREPGLVNHKGCEARAEVLGLVPAHPLEPVEDTVTTGPDAFDTRVVVGVDAKSGDPASVKSGPLVGHVVAYGAYVRKCLFFHLSTEVPSADDEATLSQRLALTRVRMLAGLKLDELDSVPREVEAP